MIRRFLSIRKMSSVVNIPEVDIDPTGVFKYILINMTLKVKETDKATDTKLVRGYEECPYHTDINDKFTEVLQKLKEEGKIADWSTKVLGGGRIDHDPAAKTIKVYGYSQGYGKPDHQIAVNLLKKVYPNYNITCSDEGY